MKTSKSNDQVFVDEIIHSCKTKDLIKIKILLRESNNFSASSTKRLLLEISRSEEEFSIPLLVHILTYHNELVVLMPTVYTVFEDRMNSISGLEEIYASFTDLNEKCFFIESLSNVDSTKVETFLGRVVKKETEVRVLLSILKAMAALKCKSFATCISDFLYSDNPELIQQTVRTLGYCGTDLAVDLLASRSGADTTLDKLIVETLGEIGTDKSIKALSDFLETGSSSSRNSARKKLAGLKERAIPALQEKLLSQNKNVVIMSLNVLGESGSEEAVKPVRNIIESMPEDANIRFAAYEALGLLPGKSGAYTLTQGLLDEDESVRVAAAKALNRSYDQIFERGIANLFRSEEYREMITAALLVSESNKIVSSMVHLPEFNECAVKVLNENRDPDLINFYSEMAKNINLTCDISLKSAEEKSVGNTSVIVVDDSRLLLRIYKKILTELNVEFELFEFAGAALNAVKEKKPKIILTDLNMPEMDGIEFTAKIREIYSGEELPVVMVTTQDEEADRSAAMKAGVQDYLHKPFDKEGIEKVLKRFTV